MNGRYVFVQTVTEGNKPVRAKNAPKINKNQRNCNKCGKRLSSYNLSDMCFSCGNVV